MAAGRILGFDIGEARIGVAISDDRGVVATPLVVLDRRALASDKRPLSRLLDDYEPVCLVVGLPRTLAGDEGPQAQRIRDDAAELFAPFDIDVVFYDERNSSKEAARALREVGMDARQAREKIDMMAAAIILQSYLDFSSARFNTEMLG
ncbi:MAG: Holliday junction resolvase RuvX [Coriobacteriia bacterium]|nr:Holliday junction resolvase RuvX [Coriobacteriia bacterium]